MTIHSIELDDHDARLVIAALDAYGIHLGELVALGVAVATDLDDTSDELVPAPVSQGVAALVDELAAIRERILMGVQGESYGGWGEPAPAEYCWCGQRAIARVDDMGLATEAPEGSLLCESHHEQLMDELAEGEGE